MKVREIPFKGIRFTDEITGAQDLRPLVSRTWSGPIQLPEAVRLFGKMCGYFNLSAWGGLRFTEATGRYHYWSEDGALPQDVSDTKKGWLLAPWGELQRLATCGTTIEMFKFGGIIVVDFNVKDDMAVRHYQYQVQFDLRKPNIVEFHYYNCTSKWNTFVGAVADPDQFVSWNMKENQLYARKALQIDTSLEEVAAPVEEAPTNTPFGNVPIKKDEDIPPKNSDKFWRVVYDGHGYQVREPLR